MVGPGLDVGGEVGRSNSDSVLLRRLMETKIGIHLVVVQPGPVNKCLHAFQSHRKAIFSREDKVGNLVSLLPVPWSLQWLLEPTIELLTRLTFKGVQAFPQLLHRSFVEGHCFIWGLRLLSSFLRHVVGGQLL